MENFPKDRVTWSYVLYIIKMAVYINIINLKHYQEKIAADYQKLSTASYKTYFPAICFVHFFRMRILMKQLKPLKYISLHSNILRPTL